MKIEYHNSNFKLIFYVSSKFILKMYTNVIEFYKITSKFAQFTLSVRTVVNCDTVGNALLYYCDAHAIEDEDLIISLKSQFIEAKSSKCHYDVNL